MKNQAPGEGVKEMQYVGGIVVTTMDDVSVS